MSLERPEALRQLRHDASALGVAHSTPGPDFGKSAPAPDTRCGDWIKRAHFVARTLDAAHESPWDRPGQDKEAGAEGNRRTLSPVRGVAQAAAGAAFGTAALRAGAPSGDVRHLHQGINAVVECRTGNLQPHVHVVDCGGREAWRST